MPFVLETGWLLLIIVIWFQARAEKKRMRVNDPQLRAVKDFGTGYRLLQQQEYTAALGYFTQVLAEPHTSPAVVYWLRAQAYEGLGEFHAAIADCTQALNYDYSMARAYEVRGRAHEGLGQTAQALENYDYMIRLNGLNPEYFFRRARLLASMGNNFKAEKDLVKARELQLQNT